MLARKELAGEPFTQTEADFLKRTVDISGGDSGPPRYNGWYPKLFGDHSTSDKADPTVSDVHADPSSGKVLEVGVGDANFLVIAVDNETDHTVYVGPVYSYYEIEQAQEHPMTDREWSHKIESGHLPDRPAWTQLFQGPAQERAFLDPYGFGSGQGREPAPAPSTAPPTTPCLGFALTPH